MPPVEVAAGTERTTAEAETRITDAALRCIGRWGIAKTTLEDVAREARCSRATVYRAFPGGKDALIDSVVAVELQRFFGSLANALAAADTLEDVLVVGMSHASRALSSHRALQYLLIHEPGVVLPRVTFHQMDVVLRTASAFAAPYLARWLDDDVALRAAEWAARITVSYTACPAEGIEMRDPEAVRRLVRTFVLPGIHALSATTAVTA